MNEFFTEQGMKSIKNGWNTPQGLYRWTDHIYRKGMWFKSQRNVEKYFSFMELLNRFSTEAEDHFRRPRLQVVIHPGSRGVVFSNLAINRFGTKTKYAKDRAYMEYRIKGCYSGIKAGLQRMEQRAEDEINMSLCWQCGADLEDKRYDECNACRNDGKCPTCDGTCEVLTGVKVLSRDRFDPIDYEVKSCPDCGGIGDYDSYSDGQGA